MAERGARPDRSTATASPASANRVPSKGWVYYDRWELFRDVPLLAALDFKWLSLFNQLMESVQSASWRPLCAAASTSIPSPPYWFLLISLLAQLICHFSLSICLWAFFANWCMLILFLKTVCSSNRTPLSALITVLCCFIECFNLLILLVRRNLRAE